MKKTNAIIDDWRTLKLSEDLNETEIKKLNFFYCAAHVLLGFHNEITKSLKELAKLIFEDLFLSDRYASHCCLAPFFSSPRGPNTSEEVLIKRSLGINDIC
jgi:hypothetical protein